MIRRDRDLSQIDQAAEQAFQQVSQKVRERALQTNTPILVYKNGEIQRIDPKSMLPIVNDDSVSKHESP